MANRKTKQPLMVVNLWLIVLFVSRLKALSASVHSDDSIPGMRTHKRREDKITCRFLCGVKCNIVLKSNNQSTLTRNKAEKSCYICGVSL